MRRQSLSCKVKNETGPLGPDQKIYRANGLTRIFRRGDFILTGIILLACLLLWGRMFTGFTAGQDSREAEIVVAGIPIMRVDLDTMKITYDKKDTGITGGNTTTGRDPDGNLLVQVISNEITMKILFQNGTVRFSESNCPDKICVHTGSLLRNGQVAACVPADVLIRIRGTAQKGDVDVIIR